MRSWLTLRAVDSRVVFVLLFSIAVLPNHLDRTSAPLLIILNPSLSPSRLARMSLEHLDGTKHGRDLEVYRESMRPKVVGAGPNAALVIGSIREALATQG